MLKKEHLILFFVIFGIFVIFGCGAKEIPPKKINVGQSTYFRPEVIRTIAMMPLRSVDEKIADEIARELTVQILQLDRFEVIDHYKVAAIIEDEGLEAEIDITDAIVKKIGQKLRADAILLGEITEFQAIKPKLYFFRTKPKITLTLRMISLKERVPTTIWSINDTFDAEEKPIQVFVAESDREKLQSDVHFFVKTICAKITDTLNF